MEMNSKFFTNKDGLEENTVTGPNGENFIRSVGMGAFGSAEEMKGRLEEIEGKESKEHLLDNKMEFMSEVRRGLSKACEKHWGKSSLEEAVRGYLIKELGIFPENINIGVEKNFSNFWLEIKATKYGDLEFDRMN